MKATDGTRYLGPGWLNRPKVFDGSPEQGKANFKTHHWIQASGDIICNYCEAKTWYADALYPCGQSAPREDVYVGGNPSLVDLHPGIGRMAATSEEAE